MAGEAQVQKLTTVSKKRKKGQKKGGKKSKNTKVSPRMGKNVKIDKKMQKLFRKRAREYHSDDDNEDDEMMPDPRDERVNSGRKSVKSSDDFYDDEGVMGQDTTKEEQTSDEEDGIQIGVLKFTEGCKAFRIAFSKIMKRNIDDESLGPVLSAHKKLVVTKLAEEATERKAKGEAKKTKHLVEEKGHVKPANFLDSHEKFLIGVATKGVVKLFNAVNKAQHSHAQKGENSSGSKGERALRERRKQVFFSELQKASSKSAETVAKASRLVSHAEGEEPAWAPLRDTYMLTNSKLKDWDKMADSSAKEDIGATAAHSSDDDDD